MGRSLKALLVTFVVPGLVHAHGGGLDAKGCHTNRKTGEYHCHRAGYSPSSPAANTIRTPRATPSQVASPQPLFGSKSAAGVQSGATANLDALTQIVERQEATIMRLMSEIVDLKTEVAVCRANRR